MDGNSVDPTKVINALGDRLKASEIENAMLKVALADANAALAASASAPASTDQPQA